MLETLSKDPQDLKAPTEGKSVVELKEHIVEIISDSGEGAQKCGQSFGAISAKMGNGIWTVEIIPAEIQPPARSVEGASGNRIRTAGYPVTNGGDETNLVVGFNEQVLLSRVRDNELADDCIILLEDKWRTDRDEEIVKAYAETHAMLTERGYRVREIPMEVECLKYIPDPKRGKNMFVLGLLASIYSLDMDLCRQQIDFAFGSKGKSVVDVNVDLLEAGYEWAEENLEYKFVIKAQKPEKPKVVVSGNMALSLGVLASGIQVCSMYPITPATSVSHYLSDVFEKAGGVVHQAEDEIAACAFAIGASYAGKCAITITSGPGFSLKQEAMGLAVMAEIPLVVVNVQRGGPSTGQPTKAEQGDLLSAMYGGHGDAPKVVFAPSSIEECFYSAITARKIAETMNMVVVILTDANLAAAQQPFNRPQFQEDWVAPPIDQSTVPEGAQPYDWDARTGLARRFIPGQPGGMHTLTGLAHDRQSHVAYAPEANEEGIRQRSNKLAAFQKTLKTPEIFGDEEGDLLIIGWGSTRGTIEEAVGWARDDGRKVSSLHLQFLQPMASGIEQIMQRFKQVITVESCWSDSMDDEIIDQDNRRYSALAMLLRSRYLVDVDCWTEVRGQPIKPGRIRQVIEDKLKSER